MVIPLTVNKIAWSGGFGPLKPSFPQKRSPLYTSLPVLIKYEKLTKVFLSLNAFQEKGPFYVTSCERAWKTVLGKGFGSCIFVWGKCFPLAPNPMSILYRLTFMMGCWCDHASSNPEKMLTKCSLTWWGRSGRERWRTLGTSQPKTRTEVGGSSSVPSSK